MKITRRFRLLPALLFMLGCLLVSSQIMAATAFKIITLQHRLAEDMLPAIQPLAGNGGTVTAIQNHLIIQASPENMAEIEQVIASLDVARQNLKITVRLQNNLQTESTGVTVYGRKRIGNVEISTSRLQWNTKGGLLVDIDNNRNSSRSSSNQYINVVDGERAFIRVGQSVPFTQEWIMLTRRYARVQQTTDFVDISTGFSVRPRSIGNQVELTITPRISKLNQSGYVDFEELTTTIQVNRGEWLDLGGMMQQKDDVSRAILSYQPNSQSQSNQLAILVE